MFVISSFQFQARPLPFIRLQSTSNRPAGRYRAHSASPRSHSIPTTKRYVMSVDPDEADDSDAHDKKQGSTLTFRELRYCNS